MRKLKSQEIDDIEQLTERLYDCKLPSQKEIQFLSEKAKEILVQEPNVVNVRAPVYICGDIHGQFNDLMELFKIGGHIPYSNYLFLGDYVDRGHQSIETVCLLICLKIRYRQRLTILRGNHQSRTTSKYYGFYDECFRKYGNVRVWETLTQLFNYLPVSALIENRVFGTHGGLSKSFTAIDQIQNLNRFSDIPGQGPICDLLWSDPGQEFEFNYQSPPRGIGCVFGEDISMKFNYQNGLERITRAHQLMQNGYEQTHNNNVTTVFSAPNYCYRCANLAAIIEVDENMKMTYLQFDPSPSRGEANLGKKTLDYFL